MAVKSLHSICRWTFNPGKGGFVPGDMRPEWGGAFSTPDMIKLVGDKIAPQLPDNIELGIELHYNAEVDDDNAAVVADALVDNNLYLAMITPGAHCHFGYGGVASPDTQKRKAAEELGTKTVDLAYGTIRENWQPDTITMPPSVIWNSSFDYDKPPNKLKHEGWRETECDIGKDSPRKQKTGTSKLRGSAQRSGFRDPDKIKRAKNGDSSDGLILIEKMSIWFDLPKDIIVITPEKLRSHLNENIRIGTAKMAWIAPLMLFVAVLVTLTTSEFQNRFLISGPTWHAVFLIGLVLSSMWLAYSTLLALSAKRHRGDIVTDIKNESTETLKEGQWVIPGPLEE